MKNNALMINYDGDDNSVDSNDNDTWSKIYFRRANNSMLTMLLILTSSNRADTYHN